MKFMSRLSIVQFSSPIWGLFSFLQKTFSEEENNRRNYTPQQRLQNTVPVHIRLLMAMKARRFLLLISSPEYFRQKEYDPFLKDPCTSEEADKGGWFQFFLFFRCNIFGKEVSLLQTEREQTCFRFLDMVTSSTRGRPTIMPSINRSVTSVIQQLKRDCRLTYSTDQMLHWLQTPNANEHTYHFFKLDQCVTQ